MSMNTRIPNRPDDDLDRLFRSYYQAELPARWPAAPKPWNEKPLPAIEPNGDSASKSRWALAASVAMLLGGCWYLGTHSATGTSRPGFDLKGGEANVNHVKDIGKTKTPPKMP
jgi:hypothetical protein